mmetsp:Transcript_89861/g.275082  ORF Transcript_89861/g.275082 Transcript_89861/m.275082 type:complete len:260 (+) Transcript_89861:1453-2232(+)
MLSCTVSLASRSKIVMRLNFFWRPSAKRRLASRLVFPLASWSTFTLMSGVAQDFEPVWMISRSRGMPNVTLAPPWPAKWKVFSVICVLGSPMLCAAMTPTASPGSARHRMNLRCMYALKASASSLDIDPLLISFWMYSSNLFSCNSEVLPKQCAGLSTEVMGSSAAPLAAAAWAKLGDFWVAFMLLKRSLLASSAWQVAASREHCAAATTTGTSSFRRRQRPAASSDAWEGSPGAPFFDTSAAPPSGPMCHLPAAQKMT